MSMFYLNKFHIFLSVFIVDFKQVNVFWGNDLKHLNVLTIPLFISSNQLILERILAETYFRPLCQESKYGVFPSLYLSVFSPNAGKYGPEKLFAKNQRFEFLIVTLWTRQTPYFDTFHEMGYSKYLNS